MGLLKLYDESKLIQELQADTVRIINRCPSIEAIKQLVSCHEVLDLSLEILEDFGDDTCLTQECDEQALLFMLYTLRELAISHSRELPQPDFSDYIHKVIRLLTVLKVPRNR